MTKVGRDVILFTEDKIIHKEVILYIQLTQMVRGAKNRQNGESEVGRYIIDYFGCQIRCLLYIATTNRNVKQS